MASAQQSTPRCVVLPIVGQNRRMSRIGLALHFLIGNVIVLYPGFKEFWFGWRVAKIFPLQQDFLSYCLTGVPDPKPISTGQSEGIRYWIVGALSGEEGHLFAGLSLIDTETEARHHSPAMEVDATHHLVGLRRQFVAWLDACGHHLSKDRQEKAFWPEDASADGLYAIGRALETFYLQSAYRGDAPVEMPLFETAVEQAPDAFMSHDLLGWARYRNGLYSQARAAFLKSVTINPSGAGAMSGLMWCGVLTQDRKEAEYWAARQAETCNRDVDKARQKALRLLEKYR